MAEKPTTTFTVGADIKVYYVASKLAAADSGGAWVSSEIFSSNLVADGNEIKNCDAVPDITVTPNSIEATHYGTEVSVKRAGVASQDDLTLTFDVKESDSVHAAILKLSGGTTVTLAIVKGDGTTASKPAVAYVVLGSITKPGVSFPKDELSKCSLTISPEQDYQRIVRDV